MTPFGNLGASPQDPTVPTLPTDPVTGEDITLLGKQGRSFSGSVRAGATVALNELDGMTFDAGFRQLSFSGNEDDIGKDYRTYSAETSFLHRVSEYTSVGYSGGIEHTDYDDPEVSDATSVVGMLTASSRLAEYWDAEVSAGVSATRLEDTALRPRHSLVSFATTAAICRRDSRQSVCFNLNRTPQPSAIGGVRTSTSVGITGNRQLSEDDRVSVGISYARSSSADMGPTIFPSVEFANARATYNHQFTERLDGFIFGSTSRTYREDLQADANISLGVGIRLSIGDRR